MTNISGYCAPDLADYVVAAMYFAKWKHGLCPAACGNYNVWRLLIWTGAIFIIIIFFREALF
ncbi:hypothetical protein ACTQ56_09235 [[Clostridium] aminophilum]|uniref:hypothetical protein n=1 Tax=[Clostridium] aminophilum TaxID=1526 RepID=UPI0026F138AC|nr:hypothetical protein [[Clostridium] aminophilum]MDD6197242.1 hypothetical protein [[Clostridium] aminophilum]